MLELFVCFHFTLKRLLVTELWLMTLWGSLSSSLIPLLSPSTPHLASLFFISFDLLWEGGELFIFLRLSNYIVWWKSWYLRIRVLSDDKGLTVSQWLWRPELQILITPSNYPFYAMHSQLPFSRPWVAGIKKKMSIYYNLIITTVFKGLTIRRHHQQSQAQTNWFTSLLPSLWQLPSNLDRLLEWLKSENINIWAP